MRDWYKLQKTDLNIIHSRLKASTDLEVTLYPIGPSQKPYAPLDPDNIP